MAKKRKRVLPAPPVTRHSELVWLEQSHRNEIARTKETNPAKGTDMSLCATARMSRIDAVFKTGKKIKTNAKKGHEQVHGTPEEKQARWKKYKDAYLEKKAQEPSWTTTNVRVSVAREFRVSYKTIERHTKNL